MQETQSNIKYVIGADECGYGSWAGPLCIAAVMAPSDWTMPGLKDSKKLSEKKRDAISLKLWKEHHDGTIQIVIGLMPSKSIDMVGLATAQRSLFVDTINGCVNFNEHDSNTIEAIVDGKLVLDQTKLLVQYKSVIKADDAYPTVMAASIVAKVYRDTIMKREDAAYPGYDFANNVGYGTPKHYDGLVRLGACPLHRMSYKPLKKFLTWEDSNRIK